MSASSGSVVIIGTGTGAANAAVNLRRLGWRGEIAVVSTISSLALEMMEPDMLSGLNIEKRVRSPILSTSLAKQYGIDMIWAGALSSIDRDKRQIFLSDGWELPFTHLVLAPTMLPQKIDVSGQSMSGVLQGHSPYDLAEARRHFESKKNVLIWGGSISSFVLAAMASDYGCNVNLILDKKLDAHRPIPKQLELYLVDFVEGRRVKVARDSQVIAIEGGRSASGVRTKEGAFIDGEVVVIDSGRLPDMGLVREAGLESREQMTTDALLRSVSDNRIFGCGSISSYTSSLFRGQVCFWGARIEAAQGKTIARNILNPRYAHDEVPVRLFLLSGHVLAIVGLIL